MAKAKMIEQNGAPTLVINGEVYPPMTITTECADREYLRKLRETGIRIFYVIANPDWNQPGDPSFQKPPRECYWFIRPDMSRPGSEVFLSDIRLLFEAVPDAWVILRLNVCPSVEWINSHPDEWIKYSDGQPRPMLLTNASRYTEVASMHSLCSEVWRKDADAAIQVFFDQLEATPYFERVIGVFLCAGGTSEWY